MVTETSSANTASAASIVQTLGSGSGVDTAALVTALVEAQFAAKNAQLTAKDNALTAQVSSVASLQSGISGFASALTTLVKGGTLATQPTSSDTKVLTATAQPGAKLANLSAAIAVTKLAAAQSATTATALASRTTVVGTGVLTLTFGKATVASGKMSAFTAGSAAPVKITIDSAHQTLDGIASAINAAATGVTASIVTNADGTAKLSLKGPTGADKAFTLAGDTTKMKTLNVGVNQTTTTIGTAAVDAALTLDGVAVTRSSNTITDLIDGVKLNLLTTTAAGASVTLGRTRPTAGLSQAVTDFVDTFNQLQGILKTATDAKTGPLRTDTAANTLVRSLRTLTSTKLVTGAPTGAPTTLAEIGVATNRDGTLSVNAAQLGAALTKWPDTIEAMFADVTPVGSGASGYGIGAALNAISTAATSKTAGLGASTTSYTNAKTKIADAEAKAADDAATLKTRLTKQFAGMDARVAAYKSTQTFLKAQVDAWNSQNK